MPLPCTPVSMSERDDSSSQSQCTTDASGSEDGSDLITPTPGPSDPSQRTAASLSTPLPPTTLTSWSSSRKEFAYPTTSEDDGEDDFPSKLPANYRPPCVPKQAVPPKPAYPTTSEDDGEEPIFPPKLPAGYRPPVARQQSANLSKTAEDKSEQESKPAAATASTVETNETNITKSITHDQDTTYPQAQPGPSTLTTLTTSPTPSVSGSSEGSAKRPRTKRTTSTQTARRKSPKQSTSGPKRTSPRTSPRNSPRGSPNQGPTTSNLDSTSSAVPSILVPSRTSSITWSPAQSLRPGGSDTVYSAYTMSRRRGESPGISPHAAHTGQGDHDMESSADESTAIFRRENGSKTGVGTSNLGYYGATGVGITAVSRDDELRSRGYEGAAEDDVPGLRDLSPVERRRKSAGVGKGRNSGRNSPSSRRGSAGSGVESERGFGAWWRGVVDKYGSVELENKGSVARDHLALERTFLAWLRTSLSFASIGIAVTQLFRLNTSISDNTSSSPSSSYPPPYSPNPLHHNPYPYTPASYHQQAALSPVDYHRLRQVGKPLGATFLGISILILLLGFHRYFESQHYVIRGKFPASRGSIFLVAILSAALIVTSLVVVVAVGSTAFEKR